MQDNSINPTLPVNDPTEAQDPRVQIAGQSHSFLQKVAAQAGLSDLYDARDITEVIFRTMRDMMTTEASDKVAEDLKAPLAEGIEDKTLYTATPLATEVKDLWQDTNPIVHFLSRIRPALNIDDKTFLFRVKQEAGLPANVAPEQAVKAVFSATKEELSSERVNEITGCLPGVVRQLWEQA